MAVSVIIPVYNAENYLERCINSLLAQTLEEIEFIFVNDCSKDRSIIILKDYETRYPNRIKVIDSSVNLRQGGARNLGMNAATGEYIGFVDADDWVEPTMFQKMYECAANGGYDVVGCHNYVSNGKGTIISATKTNTFEQVGVLDEEKRKSLIVNGGNIWIKLYKRDFLNANNIRFPEHLSYEDNYFIPIVFLLANSFGLVDEPLYYYYLSENSTVRQKNSQTQFQRFETLDLLIQKVKELGLYDKYYLELEYLRIVLLYMNTAKLCVIHFRPYNIEMLYYIRSYIRENIPRYYKNKYYISQFSQKERMMLRLNDISPRLYAPIFGFVWKIYNLMRR